MTPGNQNKKKSTSQDGPSIEVLEPKSVSIQITRKTEKKSRKSATTKKKKSSEKPKSIIESYYIRGDKMRLSDDSVLDEEDMSVRSIKTPMKVQAKKEEQNATKSLELSEINFQKNKMHQKIKVQINCLSDDNENVSVSMTRGKVKTLGDQKIIMIDSKEKKKLKKKRVKLSKGVKQLKKQKSEETGKKEKLEDEQKNLPNTYTVPIKLSLRIKKLYEELTSEINIHLKKGEKLYRVNKTQKFLKNKSNVYRQGFVRLFSNRVNLIYFKLLPISDAKYKASTLYDYFIIYFFCLKLEFLKLERSSILLLLSDYLRKSPEKIKKYLGRIEAIYLDSNNNFIYENAIVKKFREQAQEIRFPLDPNLAPLDCCHFRPIRYSFVVDVFLLKTFANQGAKKFIDDLESVKYIKGCFKRNRMIKLAWKKPRRQYSSDRSKKIYQFIGDYKSLIKREKKFYEFLLLFEGLVYKKWNYFRTMGVPPFLKSTFKSSKLTMILRQRDQEKRKSKRENIEKARKRNFIEFVGDSGPDSPASYKNFEQFAKNLVQEGIEYLKKKKDISRQKVEPLTDQEAHQIDILVKLMTVSSTEVKKAEVLRKLLTSSSESIHEYIRKLEIFFKIFKRVEMSALSKEYSNPDVYLYMSILYKVEMIIVALDRVYFDKVELIDLKKKDDYISRILN